MTTRRRLVVALAVLLGLDLVVLVVSGVFLAYRYVPDAASPPDTVDAASTAHVVSAWLLAALAVVTLVSLALTAARGRMTFWLGAVLVVGSVGYGLATGARLAWDQLALWAVTTGNRLPRGVLGLPDTVKFVLVRGEAFSRSAFSRQAWFHVLVLPAVLVVGAGLLWWSARVSSAVGPEREAATAEA